MFCQLINIGFSLSVSLSCEFKQLDVSLKTNVLKLCHKTKN